MDCKDYTLVDKEIEDVSLKADCELRKYCLQLAKEHGALDVVERAKKYYDFIVGQQK